METRVLLYLRIARPAIVAALATLLVLAPSLVASHAAASTSTLTFGAVADARVEAGSPDTNFGLRKGLLVDTQPVAKESYLRFHVTGVVGAVESATLRLFVFEGSTDGPAVYTTDDGWSETGITWNTRPARRDGPVDDSEGLATGTWVELDVTAAVHGDRTYSFLLAPTSQDGADLYSRDAAAEGYPTPELVVTVTAADASPPTVALTSPAAGSSYTSAQTVAIAAAASDDRGVERVEFSDNGTLVATDNSAPYSHDWTIARADNGPHSWTAKAIDTAGNSADSAPVQVTVAIPEPPPPPPPGGPVTASAETDPVPHTGDAADDAAIWVNPADATASTIIGTDKLGGLAVYDLAGRQLHYYAEGRPNNVDLRPDFPLAAERVALVAATNRADNTLRLYRVDPHSRGLDPIEARPIATGISVYGVCLYRSAATSAHYAFVTDRAGGVQQWELFASGDRVDARLIRSFNVGSVSEGCIADDARGALYIAEEDVAIWKYGAEPGDGTARVRVDGIGAHLTADIEGLTIYDAGNGGGYLLASSQGSDSFAVYERGGDNAYVTRFSVAGGPVDEVSGTDGIAATNVSLGGAFAEGLFVAQDNTNDGGNQNFKLVPWSRIAALLTPPEPGAPCPRPYADSSPWNTPIGANPGYDPNSDFHVTALEGALSSDPTQYTYPVYEVSATTPLQLVAISGWFSNVLDGGLTLLNQRAGVVTLPIPAGAASAAGADRQIILIDPATGDEWGASHLERDPLGNWTAWNVYHYNTQWSAVPPRDASDRPFFARGAGVPYLAGLVRLCEIDRGRIEHALAFAYDYPTGEFVYPATKSDGNGTDPADMPEGARLQLDPSVTDAQIRAWGCTGPCFTIARALQEYGMYIIDNSGREKVMLEYEGTAHWNGLVDADTVTPIPLNAFKLLDLP